jgi:hypothetical protein
MSSAALKNATVGTSVLISPVVAAANAVVAPVVNAAVNATGKSKTYAKMGMVGFIIMIVIAIVAMYYSFTYAAEDPRVASGPISMALRNRVKDLSQITMIGTNSFFGSMTQSTSPVYLPANQQVLANIIPLTASIGGYLGPLLNGVFDVATYLQRAFNAGIRSFVLPISTYHDDNKMAPNWPLSGSPAIAYRGSDGKILSLNGISVKTFCEALAQYKSVNWSQSNEPVFLYLHAVDGYVPDASINELAYVNFMNQIAVGLKSLEPFLLTTLPSISGSLVSGARQTELLTQADLREFQKKILIFTNFDISRASKGEYNTIKPTLSEYTNFTYGTASSKPDCVSVHLSDVKPPFTAEHRNHWVMTLLDQLDSIPTPTNVNSAVNIGTQCIPMPFISSDSLSVDSKNPGSANKDLTTIYKQWGGYAFRVRPAGARFTKPQPIVPQAPSANLNATIATPPGQAPLQPGQIPVR